WVFSNEVDTGRTPLAAIEPGAAVRVVDHRERFLAHALFNPHALICARVVSSVESAPITSALFEQRLRSALALRERYVGGRHYRLVYGESDGLPGLVVDRYGDVLVGQIATLAMERRRGQIEAALAAVLGPLLLVWKNDSGARELESLPKEVCAVGGELPAALEVIEAGLRFNVPLADGQKTGWFYDQWSNRALLRTLLRPGARVLDVCSYVGGWAVSAMAAGAASAACVDSSAMALEWAQRNAAANNVDVSVHRGDAFDMLAAMGAEGRQFDVLIVDPPAFVKRRKDLPQGSAAYRKLNQLALKLAASDALLVSCSCSWHLPQEALPELLQSAAMHTGNSLRIIGNGGQSVDHPVHPAMPETRYLKAVFAHVSR
ncbi:MAG TPA: class I SAM-dependent rRNA methyltransferase, partial [Steroidobacteraceae bacterium]|nr:class I SAM-dependent rRNA methyltransferase [Steroidobacteraceae bacterium]